MARREEDVLSYVPSVMMYSFSRKTDQQKLEKPLGTERSYITSSQV